MEEEEEEEGPGLVSSRREGNGGETRGLVNRARVRWMKASQHFCVALHDRVVPEECKVVRGGTEEEGRGAPTPRDTPVELELELELEEGCELLWRVATTPPPPPFALK